MLKKSKYILAFSIISLASFLVLRFLLGFWVPAFWFFVGIAILGMSYVVTIEGSHLLRLIKLHSNKRRMNHALQAASLIVVLILMNLLFLKWDKSWDLSSTKIHSLNESSIKLIKSISKNLEVYAFFIEPKDSKRKKEFSKIIEKYKKHKTNINVHFIDPNLRPDLVEKFQIQISGTIVITDGSKKISISQFTEEKISTAFFRLHKNVNEEVCFLSGHGEKDLSDNSEFGISLFVDSLQKLSFNLKYINILDKYENWQKCNLIAILSPNQRISPPEVSRLNNYLKDSGKLLVTAEPGRKHFISNFTNVYGIKYNNDFIVDLKAKEVGYNELTSLGFATSLHKLTEGFGQNIILLPVASSLELAAIDQWQYTTILKTGPHTFTQNQLSEKMKFDPKQDKEGVLDLAILAEHKTNRSKIIVLGDGDFLTNQYFYVQRNRDFGLNIIQFLSQEESNLQILPKAFKREVFILTSSNARVFLMFMVIPIPFAFLVMAAITWYKRKYEV